MLHKRTIKQLLIKQSKDTFNILRSDKSFEQI